MMHRFRSTAFALLAIATLLGLARPASADEGGCLPEARILTAEQFLEQVRNAQQYLEALDTPVLERETTVTESKVGVRLRGRKGHAAERSVVRKEKYVALSRHITIRAYDECDGSLHTVALRVPHPLPGHEVPRKKRTGKQDYIPVFAFTSLTSGYEVAHEGGLGVARLKFSVKKDGRPLTVLAMKHPRIPSKYWRSRDPHVLEAAKAVVYSAYQPEYHGRPFTDELVAAGVRRWLGDIDGALSALNESGARSFAFPDEFLARTWPPELLLMLGTIEQSDDGAFRDDAKRTAEAVAIEYAINPEPFYFSNSSANAIGPYQFTDKWKGSKPGTYSTMVRKCADAGLAPSFERGARDLRNSVRAAVCLLDLELARMPDDARRLFREDYQLGAAYPVAAYNAGGRQSAKLYDELAPDALADAARSLDLPIKAFQYRKTVARGKKRTARVVMVNNETRYYLMKMFTTWAIVDNWMARAHVPVAAPLEPAEPPEPVSAGEKP